MIKLVRSSFYKEKETREKLSEFVSRSEKFSMGEQCALFEKNFSAKQGRKHSVFVSSGSMANLVLIQALRNIWWLVPECIVGVSAITWSTNVMPIIQLGMDLRVLNCSKDTLNVSSETLMNQMFGLRALFITNALGFCGDLNVISELCRENGVVLLEDNCEALGSKAYGKKLGNFGLASTFSFFVGHHLSTIEGGMICTDDDDLYDALIMARSHGWARDLSPEKQETLSREWRIDKFHSRYAFYSPGYNARPTEIAGFLGNCQLYHWDYIVSKRQSNFFWFNDVISRNEDLISMNVEHMDVVSNFAVPVICRNSELAEKYRKRFVDAEVEIRPVIAGNIARQPFLSGMVCPTWCNQSDFVNKNGFYFGNDPEFDGNDISFITKLLEK